MKTTIGTLLALTMGSSAMAAQLNITGSYRCSDGGVLSLEPTEKLIYASLEYKDGSASTLAYFEIESSAKRGNMYRDDEDSLMGAVFVKSLGSVLVLKFDGGEKVTCRK